MVIVNTIKFKKIIGYDYYYVSRCGEVYSMFTNKILSKINTKGYSTVRLYKNRKSKSIYIHRLVATAFIPNPKNKPQINHINGIRDDNILENLEWCTQSENNQHAYDKLGKIGSMTGKFGILHHNSKKVNQYDIFNNFIKKWDCLLDIERGLGISYRAICNNLNGWSKTAGGFKWEYSEVSK